tara:strand:+ start:761 stop:883 length:123 start_codon:yes stop_codon:yes gene_type:complete
MLFDPFGQKSERNGGEKGGKKPGKKKKGKKGPHSLEKGRL